MKKAKIKPTTSAATSIRRISHPRRLKTAGVAPAKFGSVAGDTSVRGSSAAAALRTVVSPMELISARTRPSPQRNPKEARTSRALNRHAKSLLRNDTPCPSRERSAIPRSSDRRVSARSPQLPLLDFRGCPFRRTYHVPQQLPTPLLRRREALERLYNNPNSNGLPECVEMPWPRLTIRRGDDGGTDTNVKSSWLREG